MRTTPSIPHACAIGVDIGGTTTRAATVTPDGHITHEHRLATPRDPGPQRAACAIADAITHVTANAPPGTPVGLAVPATLDADRHRVRRSINLPWLERLTAADLLPHRDHLPGQSSPPAPSVGSRPPHPATLVTDAEAATWAEYIALTPRPSRFIHLRLGTGIAFGAVIAGNLQPTDPDRTTHSPLLIVEEGHRAARCPCGLAGCLETIASGRALQTHAAGMGRTDLADLQRACICGDPRALMLLERAATAIALAIDRLAAQFAADAITIGGGVLAAWPRLMEELTAARPAPTGMDQAAYVRPAHLGDHAGVIGAALMAIRGTTDR